MNPSTRLLALVSTWGLFAAACGGVASSRDGGALDAPVDAPTDAAAPQDAPSAALDAPLDVAAPDAPAADAPASDVLGATDAADAADAADTGAPLPSPPACRTGARAPIVAPGPCFTFSPDAAATALGEPGAGAGVNMDDPQFALGPDPAATDRHQLVVFIPATGSSPTAQIASPTVNFYDTAAHLGYHVLAVSYRNNGSINTDCAMLDACFWPSRVTALTGVFQPGASAHLMDIVPTEGVYARIALALAYLVRADPHGGWSQFVQDAPEGATPDARIRWPNVVTAGHSQGGGHAAAIGRLQPIARAIMLSATCDDAGGVSASWTHATAAWRTDPATAYWGLDAATVYDSTGHAIHGDIQCPLHASSWANFGLVAAHQNDTGATCGNTGNAHGESVGCVDNADNWAAMLR